MEVLKRIVFFWLFAGSIVASQLSYRESITGINLLGSHFGIPTLNASFDYVVVGGGTAGLTIATRLAQAGKYSIAVIEAGTLPELIDSNCSTIPASAANFLGANPKTNNPMIDWGMHTQNIPGFGNRSILYSQGKSLGGGSVRNLMFYVRSCKGAYQRWADEVGDDSYTFASLLPYFQKSVAFHPPDQITRPANSTPKYNVHAYSPSGGPLQVTYPRWANAMSSWFKLGLSQLGVPEVVDFVSGNILGYQYTAQTIDPTTMTRSSSETSFLRTAFAETTSLSVYVQSLAKRILFDSQKRATGVVVESNNVLYTISANKEIIVSAGALRSPQLLMVSGVGPKDTLQGLNIPVVSDRPGVGQNMQDHLLVGTSYPVDVLTHELIGSDPVFAEEQVINYVTNRTGILTNVGADFLAYEKLPDSLRKTLSKKTLESLNSLPSDWPDIELLYYDSYTSNQQDYTASGPSGSYAAADVGVVAPFSRGTVSIASNDTADIPLIYPNYLEDVRDQEVVLAGWKRAHQIWNTPALKKITTGPEAWPGSNYTTDAEILHIIQENALTQYHASSTNKMGRSNDTLAVIDPQCQVYGVTGLRVVDSSSFPFIPPSHIQATVYALAEKIGAKIIESW
ncbi:putative GMC oxidoreductase [Talaromyces proteolyticus]|uniref:GMC oxidoreductase n=1 Tax=Talaromyces proteolyticus TaxID=1131652 RepID=A0AAD4KHR9_9EURO|nr:putative GMC oxidoreductase [Talaromyces proteolyticus]KAH8692040.1 putative GMC oxidoreductase [Talaromyces proteolyticus]